MVGNRLMTYRMNMVWSWVLIGRFVIRGRSMLWFNQAIRSKSLEF